MPISTNCVVTADGMMIGERTSQHALLVRVPEGQRLALVGGSDPTKGPLVPATYSFAAGTVVESGALVLEQGNTLVSDLDIRNAIASLSGTVTGNITNHGMLWIHGRVRGNVDNAGTVEVVGDVDGRLTNNGRLNLSEAAYDGSIPDVGSFAQSATGVLVFTLMPADWGSPPTFLRVAGRADLAGMVEFAAYTDAWGPYALPAATSHPILHADGGVFGRFDRWTSPGLFIEGNLRYTANDVLMDITRISVASAMANSATITPASLQVAESLDRSFEDADDFALQEPHTLDDAQRAFLASAASIQHIGDLAQAQRTLDSLGGQAHLVASQMLDRQFAGNAARLRDRLDEQSPTGTTSAWVDTLADSARDRGSFTTNGVFAGLDTWLSPDTLVGGAIASTHSTMQLDATAGEADGTTPAVYAYLHRRNNEWHATGIIGAADTELRVRRTIDLGPGGMHQAQSQRHLSQSRVEGEIGRDLSVGQGRLVPYVGVDYERRRNDAFVERGGTGLELVAGSSTTEQWSASAGLRFSRDWQFGRNGWLRIDVDAGYRRRIAGGDADGRVAFAGTPDVAFELGAGQQQATGAGTMALGLRGGFDRRWTWMLDYEHRTGAVLPGTEWFLGARRNF
jgi:uncharacterized protein with beta-barrel porin domain